MATLLDDLYSGIESPTFVATVGVVSTTAGFERAISRDPRVRQLLGLASQPEALVSLAERIRALAAEIPEAGFAHSQDIAIAVYLRVLDLANASLAVDAARELVDRADLWWARRTAKRIAGGVNAVNAVAYPTDPFSPRSRTLSTVGRAGFPSTAVYRPSNLNVRVSARALALHSNTSPATRVENAVEPLFRVWAIGK